MRWIAFGGEAEGVVAIGQIATGVIAIGQMATGVIAIGQVARGFIAIGQGAIGVFAVGMGSVGVIGSVGMIGVGGRGLGLIFPLVPSLGPSVKTPSLTSADAVFASGRAGWVAGHLVPTGDDGPALRGLDVKFDAGLRPAIESRGAASDVWARLSPRDDGWVCDQLMEVPGARWRSPGWWTTWAIQLCALAVVCVIFWVVAGIPVVHALVDPGGILVSG